MSRNHERTLAAPTDIPGWASVAEVSFAGLPDGCRDVRRTWIACPGGCTAWLSRPASRATAPLVTVLLTTGRQVLFEVSLLTERAGQEACPTSRRGGRSRLPFCWVSVVPSYYVQATTPSDPTVRRDGAGKPAELASNNTWTNYWDALQLVTRGRSFVLLVAAAAALAGCTHEPPAPSFAGCPLSLDPPVSSMSR